MLAAAVCSAGCSEPMSDAAVAGRAPPWELRDQEDPGGGPERRPFEYHELSSEALRRTARSTAVLVDTDQLRERTTGEVRLEERPDRTCRPEFGPEQPLAGICTGFLVGPQTLVTAGHCIRNKPECTETAAVFELYYETPSADVRRVSRDATFGCRRISRRRDRPSGVDVSIVKLERPVRNRPPLPIGRPRGPGAGQQLAMVGSPGGLPLKAFLGGRILRRSRRTVTYRLPTFPGLSGSPVVDASTGEVLAIHARAAERSPGGGAGGACRGGSDRSARRGEGTRSSVLIPDLGPPLRDGRRRFRPDRRHARGASRRLEFYLPATGTVDAVALELRAAPSSTLEIRATRHLPGVGGETRRMTVETAPTRGAWTRRRLEGFDGRSPRGIWEISVRSVRPGEPRIRGAALPTDLRQFSEPDSTARRSR